VLQHGARVEEVALPERAADERDDPARVPRDLVERPARRADEARPDQQILGRVAGDRELREEDEVGAGVLRLLDPRDDHVAVPVEVADGGVDLRERDPQRFCLTVKNSSNGNGADRADVRTCIVRRLRPDPWVVARLRASSLFASVEPDELERLAADASVVSYREGDVVVEQGRRALGFFVVLEGSVSVSVDGQLKRGIGAGGSFGELSLLRDAPRSATVVAATDLRCAVLPAWEFRSLVETHPRVATTLAAQLVRYNS
jgi:hypothetical protein